MNTRIVYKNGNLLDSTAGVIIHGCNAQGVYNAGVARAVREKYPEAYQAYMSHLGHYHQPVDAVGHISIAQASDTLLICNGITQEYYGRTGGPYVTVEAIGECFLRISRVMTSEKYTQSKRAVKLHFPKIGTGLGGLNWGVITPVIDKVAAEFPAIQYICHELPDRNTPAA